MLNTRYKTRHYYNDILFTPWPFCIGICLFLFIYLTLLMFNKYILFDILFSQVILFSFFYLMCESILAWCTEVVHESFSGKYSKKLRAALVFGFILFLVSEAMLFGSIFWSYFDRLFHLSYVTGFLSVPTTVETIKWYKEPLYATIVLLASGWSANYAYYLFQLKDVLALKKAYLFSFLTNLLGCIFLYIQYVEYTHLSFTISDTVYCGVFFALTGFHGIHVLIGNAFLYIQYRLKFLYIDNKVHALGYAVLYWHFVDIIWIFLFISLYFFNNLDYLTIALDSNSLFI
jgi:heme/copper-type cytochrome/quinol oxidase subunit 3